MTIVVALVIAAILAIGGFLLGYELSKQNAELRLSDAERDLRNKIGEALRKNAKLDSDYQELKSQIKAMATSNASVDDLNRLYQKIRESMQSK